MRRCLLVCASVLGLLGCRASASTDPGESPSPPAAAPTDEPDAPASEVRFHPRSTAPTIFAAAGDEGVVGVAVWPERWPEIRTALKGLAGGRPLPIRTLVELGQLSSAWSALAAFAGAIHLPFPEHPPASFDRTAPIVVSAFAPLRDYEDTLLELVSNPGVPALAGLRHRVVIPTRDPDALCGEITVVLEANGFRSVANDATLRRPDVALRCELGPSWLVLDIASGIELDGLDFDALGAPRADFALAGALFEGERSSAGRLHLRLDALGRTASMNASWDLDWNVAHGELDDATMASLLSFGTGLALYPHALIDPRTALVHDLLLEVSGDPAQLHLGLALTEAGFAVASADAELRVGRRVRLEDLDWRAMLDIIDTLPHPPALASLGKRPDPDDLTDVLADCALGCRVDSQAGNGLLWVAAARRSGDRKTLEELEVGAKKLGLPVTVTLEDGLLLANLDGVTSSMAGSALPPIASVALDPATVCRHRYLLSLGLRLRTIFDVRPGRVPSALLETRDVLSQDLECAKQDTEYEARARKLAEILEHLAVVTQWPGSNLRGGP